MKLRINFPSERINNVWDLSISAIDSLEFTSLQTAAHGKHRIQVSSVVCLVLFNTSCFLKNTSYFLKMNGTIVNNS